MKNVLTFTEKLCSDDTLLLKFKIVSLWLSLDPTAISLRKTIFADLLLIMLDVFTNNDDAISFQSKTTLRNFLKSTRIFEDCENEIDLVLHSLKNAKVEKTTVLVDIIKKTIAHADEFKHIIRAYYQKSEIYQENDVGEIDKLLNDLSSENIENIECEIFIEKKVPSPLFLGCLQLAKESEANRETLEKFVALYCVNLMHHYESPQTMLTILESYQTNVPYISSWTETPVALAEDVTQRDEIMNKISHYIITGDTNFEDIFPHFEVVEKENSEMMVRGKHIKWNSPLMIDTSELLAWSNLVTFNLLQLTKLNTLNPSNQERLLRSLEAIMAIAKQCKAEDVCRKILHNVFTNSLLLQYFSPICKPNDSAVTLLTKFVVGVVELYGECLLHLHSRTKLMKPYQHKTFIELRKVFRKILKKKSTYDNEIIVKVLELIGMNKAETIEIVKLILNMDPKHLVTERNDTSIVMKILLVILGNASSSSDYLPCELITKIFNLYTTVLKDPEVNVTMISFECILKEYFEKQPQHVRLISKDSFKNFFSSKVVRKSTSQLAAALLYRNYNLCEVFKQEIINPEVIGQRELALPLGEAVIGHPQFIDQNKQLLEHIYNEYKCSILKVLEKPHKVGQIYSGQWRFIRKLIYECMDAGECAKFFEKVHKFETIETFHFQLLQAVFLKICINNGLPKKSHLVNYYTMMLSLLSAGLKSEVEYEILKDIAASIETVSRVSKGMKAFEIDNKEQFKKLTANAVWQNFCKTTLKDSLKIKTVNDNIIIFGPRLLSLFSSLVEIFYQIGDEDIIVLFDMVTSHSEFLNVMLSHHSTDIKSRLIELLCTLISKNKSVMKSQQIPVYLSAYHATRNPSDRLLLNILHLYEVNEQTVHEYKPYVWGDSGANYYAVRKNRPSSLWGHPTPNQILNLLDRDVVEKTIEHFPVNEGMDYKYELPSIDETENSHITSAAVLIEHMRNDIIFTFNKKKDVITSVNGLIMTSKYDQYLSKIKETEIISESHIVDDESQSIYDPKFLLIIMSQLLAPGSVVSCFKLVRSGLLGLPLVALSSYCPMMRAAGYHVLHRFCQQMETELKHRNDKLFIMDFIDTLRQSLSTAILSAQKENINLIHEHKNPRLPAIAALYLARSISVATAPFDPLYKPVNNFLIAKQQIDLTVIPDFLSLFHDNDIESAERRLWILKVMADGAKSMSDVNVIFKTMALKMVMDFYLTVLADRKTKNAILEFLSATVSIPRSAEILIEGYGLMSWLNGIVKDLRVEEKGLVVTMIKLLNNLHRSLSVSAFAKMMSNQRRRNETKNDNITCINHFGDLKINREVEQQILLLILDLLPILNALSRDEQLKYLNVLVALSKKTLKHINKNNLNLLIKNITDGFESSPSVSLLVKSILMNDSKILKIENLIVNSDDAEEYSARIDIVRKLRSILISVL